MTKKSTSEQTADEGAQLLKEENSFASGNDLPRHRHPSARLLCQAIQEPR